MNNIADYFPLLFILAGVLAIIGHKYKWRINDYL